MAIQPGTLKARKQQLVRSEIWDAAIDLFAEVGFDETTIEQIAKAAGVSKRSFFRYFSSKDDLMLHGLEAFGAALTQVIAACPAEYSPLQVVRQTVTVVATHAVAQPRTRKIMAIANDNPAARAAQLSQFADVEQRVIQAFAARNKASKDLLTPRLLTALTFSIIDVSFRLWFKHNRKDVSATIERVFATLAGLGFEQMAQGR